MKRSICLLGMLALACAAGKAPAPTVPPAAQAAPVTPPPDNLEIVAYEVVNGAEQDCPARVRVFVDNILAGQTEEGPRSQRRRWSARVPPGNRLLRLERWTFPRVWDWSKAPDESQPPERFVRVRPGMRTIVRLKSSDGGREPALEVSQAPEGP